jgi:inorganic triphosphatase YgiF
LPTDDPAGLLQRLSRVAVLKRRKPVQQRLHSTYFDTAQQLLRQAQAALRLRRVDGDGAPRWLQTLKTGAVGSSALSRRGEWEAPVGGPALEAGALDAATWSQLDPDGSLFKALGPCFVTEFTRTAWMVRRRDASLVEVALDIGAVVSGERSTPICELELELKAGPVSALFEIAQEIAGCVPVLPLTMSKAQRGYALACDALDRPTSASPPDLSPGMSLHETARLVLQEMFGQFTANLNALCRSDDPEVVHQARVGWRRFRSARRLFRPLLPASAQPDWTALRPLLDFLGHLRDLDVARTDILPPLRDAFVADSDDRARAWDAMSVALAQAGTVQRTAVRYALQEPAVGLCLLQATRWLDPADRAPGAGEDDDRSLKRWATRRATRLHARLTHANKTARDPQALHEVRLMAKRTRYGIEALRGVLPRHMVRHWHPAAVALQKCIGADRDLAQAITQLERVEARSDLTAFVRGVAIGRSAH